MNNNIEIVDARGLSCPQPVMLTSKAIKKLNKGAIEVLADSGTARDNVSRLGKNSGWAVTVEEQPEGSYRIVLKK
ncbi:MAG: sulfurtransferase TusA family protein [Pseudomonadota bacterium]|nr:sulfurtransferase TusA family protein [Pseudomonadota bacterium]MBU2027083.1 sulfurtransferase TusA family protein [Pseudomonadota bacterium]MBU2235409.1 sulfurtransferase TusA family protein [Pseudomonadota bacterium]MBU3932744.1 sulfurtransferase TusA family protein [Pseudomonadota bacterium]MBU4074855.1 sulfurtransferase TusA family protein [Pseudomonadota bacterium]